MDCGARSRRNRPATETPARGSRREGDSCVGATGRDGNGRNWWGGGIQRGSWDVWFKNLTKTSAHKSRNVSKSVKVHV
jgi:hypothetical protein